MYLVETAEVYLNTCQGFLQMALVILYSCDLSNMGTKFLLNVLHILTYQFTLFTRIFYIALLLSSKPFTVQQLILNLVYQTARQRHIVKEESNKPS